LLAAAAAFLPFAASFCCLFLFLDFGDLSPMRHLGGPRCPTSARGRRGAYHAGRGVWRDNARGPRATCAAWARAATARLKMG
jgi:hypothetical protein